MAAAVRPLLALPRPRRLSGLGARDERRDVDRAGVGLHDGLAVRPHERVEEMVDERDQVSADDEGLPDLLLVASSAKKSLPFTRAIIERTTGVYAGDPTRAIRGPRGAVFRILVAFR